MRAIQIRSHGGPEVLTVVNLPDPRPGKGEVLIRMKAAAVNPLDAIVRQGYFPVAKKPPLILGEEGAGLVEQRSGTFKKGDRVIVYGGGLGVFREGIWAELVAVPTASLVKLPKGLSFEEGAAFVNVGVTAFGALREAKLKKGETCLVLGSTGGVGSMGVQIAKALGAKVIGVATSGNKAERVTRLGANHVVDLSRGTLAEEVRRVTGEKGVNCVLDPVGGSLTGHALSVLSAFGRLVHVGYSAGRELIINSLDLIAKPSRLIGFNIFAVPPATSAADRKRVVDLAARGRLHPIVDRTFPLAEVAEATRYLESRQVFGKVVLTM